MIYMFDTSAINLLHDDPDCSTITEGLAATNQVWISALNVAEVAQTPEHERRNSLLALLRRLTRTRRPLELPILLIRRAIEAYSQKALTIEASVGEDNDIVWQVLQNPALLNDLPGSGPSGLFADQEKMFLETHRSARPHFQQVIAEGTPRLRSATQLYREYIDNTAFLKQMINRIYKDTVGVDLQDNQVLDLLETIPELAGYLLGWCYSIYRRSIARQGYGTDNAGNIDLWYATYIGRADKFVSADKKQYQALRWIAKVLDCNCEVLRYGSFRNRMIPTSE